MHKFLTFLLCVSLAFSLAAGLAACQNSDQCSSTEGEGASNEGENPTEGESPAPVEGETPTPEEGETPTEPKPVVFYGYTKVAQYPHDPQAFTQGLQYVDGELFEGTGINGQSTLRRVELETGTVLQKIDLAREYFGEGITVLGEKVYQLTWQSKKGFVYQKESFELLNDFPYTTEGWGLCNDGTRLIMSDGTSNLYFYDAASLTRLGSVVVSGDAGPISRLNELEFIKGEVYANVWQTNSILMINPETGRVNGVVDLKGILPPENRTGYEDVLNGIAYDAAGDRLFVTGKKWPLLFEIDLVAPAIK